jgi:type I restriction enzyme S subunit
VTNEIWSLPVLPQGWVWTDFESISRELKAGGTPLTKVKRYYDDGTIPFVKIEDIVSSSKYLYDTKTRITEQGLRNSSAWLVPRDSLLYSMYASYGEPIINKIEVTTSQAIIAYVPPQGLIILDYVYYYLKKVRTELTTRGTTQKNLNAQIVRRIPIPLAPFDEQVRIVAKLEELFACLDAGVEGLQKIKAQLKRYRQAVLKYAFEGKLTEEWRKIRKDRIEPATKLQERVRQNGKDYVDSLSTNKLALNGLPEDWSWEKIGDVADLISGQHIMKGDYNFDQSGLPYLTGPADFGSQSPIISKWTTKPKVVAKDGDVLVTVKGAGVGKVNILDIKEAVISRQLMAIRARHVRPKFVFYYVQYIFDRIRKLGSGSTVPGIRREELLGLPFPFAPIAEQNQIVNGVENRVQVAVEVQRILARSLKQTENLRQGILKSAFEGKLVPQDSSDEPVDKLLMRIKEERAKSEGEKGINKKKNKPKQLELPTYVK